MPADPDESFDVERAPLLGAGRPPLCVRCHVSASAHKLRVGPVRLPGAYCCACADDMMAELATTVPADEGSEGLERFRRQHAGECGWPRCTAENPCPERNPLHVVVWGECFWIEADGAEG